ncbi:MAG: O-acetyl-ADP-ribose deacetylase [Spirochaetota bacterium]|nr:O-acetyl-ADP-ribose deacetylase [Spirochaetota bacterium]
MSESSFYNNKIIIKQGDITKEKVDAIVNAANSSLMGGGGVDGAIHRAGGVKILEECREIRKNLPEGLPTGQAVITSGGNLFAKYIIHTVGPIWRGGTSSEPKLLKDCYINSLDLAVKHGIKSIAFPAISTGIYGYPPDQAAKIVFKAVKDFLSQNNSIDKIVLVFFQKSDMDIFLNNTL